MPDQMQMPQIDETRLVRRAGGKNIKTQLNKGDPEIAVETEDDKKVESVMKTPALNHVNVTMRGAFYQALNEVVNEGKGAKGNLKVQVLCDTARIFADAKYKPQLLQAEIGHLGDTRKAEVVNLKMYRANLETLRHEYVKKGKLNQLEAVTTLANAVDKGKPLPPDQLVKVFDTLGNDLKLAKKITKPIMENLNNQGLLAEDDVIEFDEQYKTRPNVKIENVTQFMSGRMTLRPDYTVGSKNIDEDERGYVKFTPYIGKTLAIADDKREAEGRKVDDKDAQPIHLHAEDKDEADETENTKLGGGKKGDTKRDAQGTARPGTPTQKFDTKKDADAQKRAKPGTPTAKPGTPTHKLGVDAKKDADTQGTAQPSTPTHKLESKKDAEVQGTARPGTPTHKLDVRKDTDAQGTGKPGTPTHKLGLGAKKDAGAQGTERPETPTQKLDGKKETVQSTPKVAATSKPGKVGELHYNTYRPTLMEASKMAGTRFGTTIRNNNKRPKPDQQTITVNLDDRTDRSRTKLDFKKIKERIAKDKEQDTSKEDDD